MEQSPASTHSAYSDMDDRLPLPGLGGTPGDNDGDDGDDEDDDDNDIVVSEVALSSQRWAPLYFF